MDNKMYEILTDEKLSEKLMQSENFKKGAREALKNEMPNANDEQLSTIIRCIQKGIQADSDAAVEQELEKVSGGVSKKQVLEIVADAVPVLTTAAGAAVGALGGKDNGASISDAINEIKMKYTKSNYSALSTDLNENTKHDYSALSTGFMMGGAGVGAVGGLGLGIVIKEAIKKLSKKY